MDRSAASWWRRWWGEEQAAGGVGVDRLLARAVLAVALLLGLAILAGGARRAVAMPAVSPAAAAGIVWLVGCAVVTIWIVLVVAGGYRDRWTGR